jgi:hypothetical protein
MFGFQTWGPCNEIISPILPDVKKISWFKKWRHFDWPLRVLKSGILKI